MCGSCMSRNRTLSTTMPRGSSDAFAKADQFVGLHLFRLKVNRHTVETRLRIEQAPLGVDVPLGLRAGEVPRRVDVLSRPGPGPLEDAPAIGVLADEEGGVGPAQEPTQRDERRAEHRRIAIAAMQPDVRTQDAPGRP